MNYIIDANDKALKGGGGLVWFLTSLRKMHLRGCYSKQGSHGLYVGLGMGLTVMVYVFGLGMGLTVICWVYSNPKSHTYRAFN